MDGAGIGVTRCRQVDVPGNHDRAGVAAVGV